MLTECFIMDKKYMCIYIYINIEIDREKIKRGERIVTGMKS
jgi:hypothetical protein